MAAAKIKRRFIAVKWLMRIMLGGLGFLLLFGTLSLYLLERGGLPKAWVNRWIQTAVDPEDARVEVDRVFLSLLGGLRAEGVAVWLPGGGENPQIACKTIRASIDWFGSGDLVSRVRAVDLDGLYVASRFPVDSADAPLFTPFRFPEGLDATLSLSASDVVDIQVERLACRLHTDSNGYLRFSDADLTLNTNGRSPAQYIRGEAWLDLVHAVVGGSVEAFIEPRRINGLFTVIGLRDVKSYIDAFELKAPAKAVCSFEAGLLLSANLCKVKVNVDLPACTYRAVPFASMRGVLSVEGARNTLLSIGPFEGVHADSSPLSGSLVVDFGAQTLDFDARSGIPLPDLYAVIDQPFTALIPEMAFNKGPDLVMNGFVPLNGDPARVRLNGTVGVAGGGHVLKLPIESATATLTMSEGTLTFDPAEAILRDDGKIVGTFALTFPDDPARGDETDFTSRAQIQKGDLADLMLPFVDGKTLLSESGSKVNATFTLSGSFLGSATNTLASLNGSGETTLAGGQLNRFHMFAGLTDLLANNIPGLSSITDQTHAKSAFTLENGILKTERLEITGDILSVEGHGTYSLPADDLDFSIIVAIFNKGSIPGYITRWVTVPVARFLMEFEMRGPIGEPTWNRKGTMRKITDIF